MIAADFNQCKNIKAEHEIDPKTALKNLDIAEKMIREGGA